ncbi:hypothetical protein [Halobacillus sp. Nhm2S1]|uniref:hypothetical protein n=1 Tax=Halobacillus sp. Nhm2S1 TaxID=2866716 RepID=UPI001C730F56|nr:hypothetical protein [Halobacillus sp. Nhm2S1]MBX0358914.1 hypothetical protein [Halobacillus sp. Nhm2S1]
MEELKFNQNDVNGYLCSRIAVLENEKAILLAEKNALIRRVNEIEGNDCAN